MTTYEKVRAYVYRHARPLDLFRWRFHFEGGSAEDVLTALSFYPNEDGGFGHAIEPDCWNPGSWPIGTWAAVCILLDVDAPSHHPLVQGVLRYLDSGADFDAAHQQWLNVVPGSNDHPHATWWTYGEKGSEFKYNPTALLAAFALLHAKRRSPLHNKARQIVRQAVDFLLSGGVNGEQHITACFLQLRSCLIRAGEPLPSGFDAALCDEMHRAICTDPERWRTGYVCRPSNLLSSPDDPFAADFAAAIAAECAILPDDLGDDGAWPISWQWWTPYREFTVAECWWKSHLIIERMRFLRGFGTV